MQIIYRGHSCVEIQTKICRILVDPFLDGNPLQSELVATLHPDFILLTHGHADHIGDCIRIARRTGAVILANYDTTIHFQRLGMPIIALSIGGTYHFPHGSIRMYPALHSSGVELDGAFLPGGTPTMLEIEMGGVRLLHAGDTAFFADMHMLTERDITVCFLPIGGRFTMDRFDALRAARIINAQWNVPIHYNTFPEIQTDEQAWLKEMQSEGLGARILEINEKMKVSFGVKKE